MFSLFYEVIDGHQDVLGIDFFAAGLYLKSADFDEGLLIFQLSNGGGEAHEQQGEGRARKSDYLHQR